MSRINKITVRPKRELTVGVGKRGPPGADGAAVLPPGAAGQLLGYGPGAADMAAGGAWDTTTGMAQFLSVEHHGGWAGWDYASGKAGMRVHGLRLP